MDIKRRQLVIFIGAVVLCSTIILSALYLTKWRTIETVSDINKAFSVDGLVLENGASLDVAKLEGRAVIVMSWASWCPSCAGTLFDLSRLKEVVGNDVEIIAVNRKEDASVAEDYKEFAKLPTNLSYVNDQSDAYFKKVEGRSMPELLFYSKDGVLIERLIASPTYDELLTLVNRIK